MLRLLIILRVIEIFSACYTPILCSKNIMVDVFMRMIEEVFEAALRYRHFLSLNIYIYRSTLRCVNVQCSSSHPTLSGRILFYYDYISALFY